MKSCSKRGRRGECCTYLPGHRFDCYDANIGVSFTPVQRGGGSRRGPRSRKTGKK